MSFSNFALETFLSSTCVPLLHIPLSTTLHHTQTTNMSTFNPATLMAGQRPIPFTAEFIAEYQRLQVQAPHLAVRYMRDLVRECRRRGINTRRIRQITGVTPYNPQTSLTSLTSIKKAEKDIAAMGPKRSLNAWMGFRCKYTHQCSAASAY